MRDGLRIAGTVEFAGLDAAPDYRRTEVVLRRTLSVMRDLEPVDEIIADLMADRDPGLDLDLALFRLDRF